MDTAGIAPNLWTPRWSNAVFSLEERDLRWARVRALMARDGIDVIVCLPCTNSHDRGQADARYLTQLGENSDETTVAFPIEGEVTAWHSRGGVWPGSNWFTDIRAAGRGTGGKTILAWIDEHPAFATSTIGIAGLDASPLAHVRAAEGEANWQSVELLERELPKARFVSATGVLGEARWRKSTEELEFLRKGTAIAERTLDAVYEHARVGVRERHVFAQMMFANADADGSFPPMIGWTSGPVDDRPHRLEQPSFRTIEHDDVLSLEIEGRWGGYIAQIDQMISFGAATTAKLETAMPYAFECFNRAMAALKPGRTIRELIAAGAVSGLGGRVHAAVGGHGRGTGDDGPLLIEGRSEATADDIVIEEGCCFALKPAASLDGKSGYARWGDTIAVTATGAIRLGTRPQELRTLP
jgi:Xaa-Pro aminopeptidase